MLRLIVEARPPHDFAGRGQRGRSLGAEMNVDAIALDDRRWRCVAVLAVEGFRPIDPEDLGVHQLTAGGDIEPQHTERDLPPAAFRAIGRGRQPNPAIGYNRGRPAAAWHRRLPDDVAGFAPVEREASLG